MNNYTYIIAGGGMSGLSLAWHIINLVHDDSRILLVDKEAKTRNDRTWCFWHKGDAPFAHLAKHGWSKLLFESPTFTKVFDLGPWQYSMIRGIDFYTWVQAELGKTGRVDMLYGQVEGFSDGDTEASILVNGRQYSAPWVFNGTFTQNEFKVPPNKHDLKQHFRGWFIETTKPTFDPSTPTFFDLDIPQEDAFRFMYVLPESSTKALVEYTFFSPTLLSDQAYDEGIAKWLNKKKGLSKDDYTIVEIEKGIIPMTDMDLPRQLGKRIMSIGSRGGRVKASTGFAFYRTQKDCLAIAKALAAGKSPFSIPPDPPRYGVFDTLLLQILYRYPNRGAEIFAILFRKNPLERIFRFLNEEGTIPENLALMASVPWWPFIRAWIKCFIFKKV